jgi:hypothetical protein
MSGCGGEIMDACLRVELLTWNIDTDAACNRWWIEGCKLRWRKYGEVAEADEEVSGAI